MLIILYPLRYNNKYVLLMLLIILTNIKIKILSILVVWKKKDEKENEKIVMFGPQKYLVNNCSEPKYCKILNIFNKNLKEINTNFLQKLLHLPLTFTALSKSYRSYSIV